MNETDRFKGKKEKFMRKIVKAFRPSWKKQDIPIKGHTHPSIGPIQMYNHLNALFSISTLIPI